MTAVLITDGDCEFCQRTAKKLANIVPTGWINVPSHAVEWDLRLNSRTTRAFSLADRVSRRLRSTQYSGAKAVGKVLADPRWLWGAMSVGCTFIPPMSWIAAGLYRLVANNRKFFSRFI